MSKLSTNRLWNARFGNNKIIGISGIEAPTAAVAEAEVNKLTKKPLVALDSEPIYETSINVELDGDDAKSENGIFEISIKGTDCAKVDELKKLLAFVMNGVPLAFEYPDEPRQPQFVWSQRLRDFIRKNALTVVSL